jgi:hypothetical protein
MQGLFEEELRSAMEHLILIKSHMIYLGKGLKLLNDVQYSPAGIVEIRRSSLDVRMIIEELMLLSVSAHKNAGQKVTSALQSSYSASKKMSLLRDLNPRFFPDAIDIVPIDMPGVEGKFVSVEDAYLDATLAKERYHFSDNILHASHKQISPAGFYEAVTRLSSFYKLTERLFRTFEVDTSGSGMVFVGHLNLYSSGPPVLFSAGMNSDNIPKFAG